MDKQAKETAPLKIVLVSLNSQYVHSSLAVWYLKSALDAAALKQDRANFGTEILEGTINEKAEAVIQRIIASEADLLGFSTYIWNINYLARILPRIKAALPHCTIVLGGPEVSYNAAEVLHKFTEVDFLISGEGESAIVQLAAALLNGGDFAAIPGLSYRLPLAKKSGKTKVETIANPALHIAQEQAEADFSHSPYSENYFAALQGRIAYLETSRGCPYHCAFCLSGRSERLQERPLEEAFADIVKLARSSAQTIKFVDRTFNVNRRRAKEILRFIIREDGQIFPFGRCFHFEIAGDLLDDETLKIVKTARAGLLQFEIGLQSMNEETLSRVRRTTDMRKLRKMVSALIAGGNAHVHLDLIAGLPGEGLEDFAISFNQAYALQAHALQLGFLKMLHGSAMREEAAEFPAKYAETAPYEVYETPGMSPEDFTRLHHVERGLDKLYNSGRFVRTLRYLTQDLSQSPFALFERMGKKILRAENTQGQHLSLEALTELFFSELILLLPEQKPKLRDLLVLDRLASTATNFLPPSLRVPDSALATAKRHLARQYPRRPGATRALALLYSDPEKRLAWADYEKRDPVTGLYPVHIRKVKEILEPEPTT